MKEKINRKELIFSLLILLIIVALFALTMWFTDYAERMNQPIKEPSIKTTVYNTAMSSSRTLRLVLEEGPGYKRMQTSGRDGLAEWTNESIYAEVK
jgi:hypothetical protein